MDRAIALMQQLTIQREEEQHRMAAEEEARARAAAAAALAQAQVLHPAPCHPLETLEAVDVAW